jgi:hypothetical protein
MGKAVCSDSERLKTFRTSENSKQAKSADTALWRGPIGQRRQREGTAFYGYYGMVKERRRSRERTRLSGQGGGSEKALRA